MKMNCVKNLGFALPAILIFAVIFCGATIGCERTLFPPELFSHDQLDDDEIRELIPGKWNWVYAIIMSRKSAPAREQVYAWFRRLYDAT